MVFGLGSSEKVPGDVDLRCLERHRYGNFEAIESERGSRSDRGVRERGSSEGSASELGAFDGRVRSLAAAGLSSAWLVALPQSNSGILSEAAPPI